MGEKDEKLGKARTFIIHSKTVLAAGTELATRVWRVLGSVTHSRHINQFNLIDRLWGTDSPTRGGIIAPRLSASSAILCHSIAKCKDVNDQMIL